MEDDDGILDVTKQKALLYIIRAAILVVVVVVVLLVLPFYQVVAGPRSKACSTTSDEYFVPSERLIAL